MRNFFDAPSDRRRAPRTKLAEIAYLGIGPENGGIVLDVSDGGLSFHAVSPVQPAESIRFLLSLKGHSRIEGSGEVVWTDDMKTVGGLRFTSLSAGAREHLDNWTNKTRMAAAGENTSASSTETESPEFDADQWATDAGSVFAIPPADEQLSSDPVDRTLWQNPVFYWIMSGILTVVLALSSFLYGVHVGRSEIRTVAHSAPKSASQASPPKIAPAPVPSPEVASNAPSVPTGMPSVPKASTTVPSGAIVSASKTTDTSGNAVQRSGAEIHVPAVPIQRAGLAQEVGKSELAAALAALNGDNGKRDSTRAVRLLWAAVSKGNATAMVTLADLYVTGDGIAKNCEQGRILLKTASSRGNAEAKVKLDELNANGCP
jgi:hypothetical protein